MSDHDTITPEADDEIRARLLAFAEEAQAHTDTELALERMPSSSRPPTIRLLAIAAVFVLVAVIAAAFVADRQSVDTVPPAESPTTECPPAAQPRAITQGAQMKPRFAAPIASAATAVLLLGACSDDDATSEDTTTTVDGPTTLAAGEDISFVGGAAGLADQTMDITAEEDGGEVSGQARFVPANLLVDLQCADTATDGLVIVAGQAAERGESLAQPGEWVAVLIQEGDPDRVVLWFSGDEEYDSCEDAVAAISDADRDPDSSGYADVTGDIETG